MRDDLDELVADRFRLLEQVSVPDTWSRVRFDVLEERAVEFSDFIELNQTPTQPEASSSAGNGRSRRGWMLTAVAALVVMVVAVAFVQRDSRTPTVVTTSTPDSTPALPATTIPALGVGSAFAAAIESSGVLTSASAEESALASDTSLYPADIGSTQVSAADRFVSLRRCERLDFNTGVEVRPMTCRTGWSYVTGSVDGREVHSGLLGEADALEAFVLDDRFFVAVETSPGVQRSPIAWLIDSVSGGTAELTWRDEPTIVSVREQALVVSEGQASVPRVARRSAGDGSVTVELFLPRVVDARDGTIRPLAVPDDASANLPVTQTGNGRIWIGTAPDGHAFIEEELDVFQVAGFAYSDDGGATWTDVTIPAELLDSERLATKDSWGLSIAADGDRIAATSAWSYHEDRYVYVSSDAGLSWSTVTVTDPAPIYGLNGGHLHVLADKRLLLVRSIDPYARQLFVSISSDWTALEENLQATQTIRDKYVSANRDGIALMYKPVEMYGPLAGGRVEPSFREHFSTDLTNWWTIEIAED